MFSEWKRGDEYSSYFFGKDGLGLSTLYLRHVHLVPVNDPLALKRWDAAWQRRPPGRKTSDRYLFYCDGGRHGFLLIYIVGDPGAHDFMSSARVKPLLKSFSDHAERFAHFGEFSI